MLKKLFSLIPILLFFMALSHPVRAVAAELCEGPEKTLDVNDKKQDKRSDDRKKKQRQTIADVLATIAPDAMPGKARNDDKLRADQPKVDVLTADSDDEYDHSNRNREGIDVSHYQGHIDWEAVAKEGNVSYVYLKATEGAEFVDNTHMYNISMARRHGLKVGSYHYYKPNVNVEQQMNNLASIVIKSEQDLVPMIDIEEDRGVSEEKFIRDITAFVHMVEHHYGKKPLLYSGEFFYNKHFQGLFQDYQWMIARYSDTAPVLKDDKAYLSWQYTDKGSIPGIRGKVDRSCLMGKGTLKQIRMK